MTLHNLPNNEYATIVHCKDKRLCDIGLYLGSKVRMIKIGNPCIINLCGIKIGIGRVFQDMIQIERNSRGNDKN